MIRLLIELVYHHYDFATYICQWGGLCSSWPLLELFILPTYWSIKFPYLSRAFASLTFIVVIRCASQEMYYLIRIAPKIVCLVHHIVQLRRTFEFNDIG